MTSQKAEALSDQIAKRASELLGIRVHLESVRYEILSSTFVVEQIEAGPASDPLLKIAGLRVRHSLFKSSASNILSVHVTGAQGNLPIHFLNGSLRKQGKFSIALESLRIQNSQLVLCSESSDKATLHDVDFSLSGFSARIQNGKASQLKGNIAIKASRLTLSGVGSSSIVFSDVLVEGRLSGEGLVIKRAIASGLDGRVELKGTLRPKKILLGFLDLKGTYQSQSEEGQPSDLRGSLRLTRRFPKPIQLQGTLQGRKSSLGKEGELPFSSSLDLQLTVSGKKLRNREGKWLLK